MSVKKNTYVVNVLYYTAMPFLRTTLTFFTLPILTRYLSPTDFGTVSLITMITLFSGMFFLGVNSSSARFYFKYRNNFNRLKMMLSTNLISVLASAFFYLIILIFAFPFLNVFFFKNNLNILWIIMAFVQYTMTYINLINQNIFQNEHKGKKWFINEAIATVVQVSLLIVLVVTRLFTFEAIIIATTAAEGAKCFITLFQLRQYYALIFRYRFFRESFSYSWPQIPTALISFGYTYIDRILISRFRGLSQVGILDISNRFSSILKMSMDGIAGVFSPLSLGILTENTKEAFKKLADISLKMVFVVLFLALSIILFTKELVFLLTTKQYYFVIYIAPIYIYYHVFGVLSIVSYWLLYQHARKTFWVIPINLTILITNVIGNIVLIPRFGIVGAACATFISSILGQGLQFFIGLKATPIPINMPKLFGMFLLLFAETGIVYFLYYSNLNVILDIVIKLVMLLFFAIACFCMKIFNVDDIKSFILPIRNKIRGYRLA